VNLKNKTILIISPQSWGNMFLAKHHYAIELAKHGNDVYFLNPPQKEPIKNGIEIVKSNVVESLFLINHSLSFSYKIKFKWIGLFHFLMSFHIKTIEKKIGKKIDIVWSFDLGDYYPFKYFSKSAFKLYNPIDEPLNKDGINSALGCDVIVSITREILEKYAHINVPKHFIHHGLAEEFVNLDYPIVDKDNTIRVGLSGNWLRTDLDVDCLLQIIAENNQIVFEFWGSYQSKQSNIGGGNDKQVKLFIDQLKQAKNVILHGVVHPHKLAIEFQKMDAFLITYDILKDQSKGTNYHKVMEYLSTGKVIVSNNITTYSSLPNLIEMTTSRTDNQELPQLFKTVINNLQYYNQTQFIAARKAFAIRNLYSNKINEIETILNCN
jgi:glycosyltransferase involved in cell wall biosynthesis